MIPKNSRLAETEPATSEHPRQAGWSVKSGAKLPDAVGSAWTVSRARSRLPGRERITCAKRNGESYKARSSLVWC